MKYRTEAEPHVQFHKNRSDYQSYRTTEGLHFLPWALRLLLVPLTRVRVYCTILPQGWSILLDRPVRRVDFLRKADDASPCR
jgi:hypothetical protein